MKQHIDSAEYYAGMQGSPEIMYRAQILDERLSFLSQGGSPYILEVGVGSGDITMMLARQYKNLCYVEPDIAICELVNARLKDEAIAPVRYICSGIENTELESGQFDNIIMLGVLEHLADPLSVLKKMAGLLKQSGTLHVTVNLAGSLHRWLGLEMGILDDLTSLTAAEKNHGHYRVYTHQTILEELTNAGFKVSYEQTYYLKPLPTALLAGLSIEQHRALNNLGAKFKDLASYIYIEGAKGCCSQHE